MTKLRISVLILAVLTALMLAGCGNDTTQESSDPEGIETFGVEINPSAQPSTGEVIPSTSGGPSINDPTVPGEIGENDVQPSGSPTSQPSATPTATPTKTPTPSSSTAPASPSPSDPESPGISPPAPASEATIDQAREYIGKSLSSLIADLGYPSSSDYAPIDEDDPDAGEIGTLYFNGFTVTTRKDADGEIITAVNES